MTGDQKRRPWMVATVAAIPNLWNVGADGVAIDEEEAFRVVCDGDEVTLLAGQVLFVAPEVFREGVALETPTTVLVVGGLPGKAYTAAPFALDRSTESG